MAFSGRQTSEGEEELEAVVADFDPVGGRSKGVRTSVQGGDTGGVVVQDGDMGTNPQYGADPE